MNILARTTLIISALCLLQGCSYLLSIGSADPIAEDAGERTTGALIDDEIVETKALVNIDKASPQLAQAHIVVSSYNGVLLLAGQVASEEMKALAGQTVAKISKVKRVHNELSIAGATSMVARSNDAWITTKVKSKMLASSELQSFRIKVVTENGVVYLLGLVSRAEADRAADIASTTAGVQKVVRIFEYII